MIINFSVFLMLLLLCSNASCETVDTLCKNNEQVIFSCQTGKKIISVCSSKPVTAHTGYVQYRFGKKDALEFVYPSLLLPPYDNFHQLTERYATASGYTHLRFKNASHTYIVYHQLVSSIGEYGGMRKLDEYAGVKVIDQRGKHFNLKCNDPVRKELIIDEDIFQTDDDTYR